MTDTRAPEQDRTAVLRRQSADIVNGATAGDGYPAYEVICRLCGDDPAAAILTSRLASSACAAPTGHSHAGTLTCRSRHARAGEEAFPGHLRQARAVLAALPGHIDGGPTGLPSEFEALRWFPLPPACPPSQATRPTSADTSRRSSPQARPGH